jgi:hypothetical protein
MRQTMNSQSSNVQSSSADAAVAARRNSRTQTTAELAEEAAAQELMQQEFDRRDQGPEENVDQIGLVDPNPNGVRQQLIVDA